MELKFGGTELTCPACGRTSRFTRAAKLRAYACPLCGGLVYPAVGTPFEKLRDPLPYTFFAVFLATTQRRGLRRQLQRDLDWSAAAATRLEADVRDFVAKSGPDGAFPGWSNIIARFVEGAIGASPANLDGIGAILREYRTHLVVASVALCAGVSAFVMFLSSDDGDFYVSVPELFAAPPKPTLVLSAVEEDLAAAKAAVAFSMKNAPSIALPDVPQLPLPSQRPPAAPPPPTPGPGSPPIAISGNPNEILSFGPMKIRRHLVDTIVKAGRVVGADPTLLMAVADKESSFATEVKASTSSATGLFQFIERTWLGVVREFGARHGLENEAKTIMLVGRQYVVADPGERARILDLRREPYISALLAAEMLKRDTLRLERRLRRHLTGGEIYLLHFLGPDAAELFIDNLEGNPNVAAADLLPKPAEANRPIFYASSGEQTKRLSVADVHKKFESMIAMRLERYREVRRMSGTQPIVK